MDILLKDLLIKISDTELAIIAGYKGVNRTVRWLHMVESVEISAFLEGNELVFITGMGLKNDNDLYELIVSVFSKKATGVVVNLGHYIEKIPPRVIEFCEKNDFPLCVVPWSVHMARIMKVFSHEISLQEDSNIELSAAIRTAIFMPWKEDEYFPILHAYGYSKNNTYCFACIKFKNGKSEVSKKKIHTLRTLSENRLAYSNYKVCCFEVNNLVFLLFSGASEETIECETLSLYRYIMQSLETEEKVIIGIGEHVLSLKDISLSYHESTNCLKLENAFPNEIIFSYKKLGTYRLLLSVNDHNILFNYYDEILSPLEKYDQCNKTDLIATLNCYLLNDCSLQKVAESLFVHKNTVYYKIKKAEDILKCDLRTMKTREELSLALKIRNIIF